MKSWRWLKYFKDAFVFRSALTAPSKRNKRCVEMFMFTRLLGFFLFRYIFLRMRQSHHSCSWKRNSKRWMSCSTLDEKPFLQLLPSELLQSKSSSSVRKALTGRASPYLCLVFFCVCSFSIFAVFVADLTFCNLTRPDIFHIIVKGWWRDRKPCLNVLVLILKNVDCFSKVRPAECFLKGANTLLLTGRTKKWCWMYIWNNWSQKALVRNRLQERTLVFTEWLFCPAYEHLFAAVRLSPCCCSCLWKVDLFSVMAFFVCSFWANWQQAAPQTLSFDQFVLEDLFVIVVLSEFAKINVVNRF